MPDKRDFFNSVLIVLCLLLVFSNLYLLSRYREEKSRATIVSPSVGEQAGQMARRASSRLQQSSQTLNAQAEETLKVLREEAGRSAVTLEGVWRDFLTLVNQELQKFRETLRNPSS